MEKFRTVRGVKDFLPEEMNKINYILKKAINTCKAGCYEEITTPIFEFSELFEKPLGETSDIVTKENYIFNDRSNNSLMLRPEGTTSVVRALINAGLTQSLPKRFYYYGPMFRYERPQKGRMRQFHQFGVELLGVDSFLGDIEIIFLAHCFLNKLGLENQVLLKVNSLGDNESRNSYKMALKSYLNKFKNDLSKDSLVRLEKNPLRILDSKDKKDIKILVNAPKYKKFLNKSSLSIFDSVCTSLQNLNVSFEIDQSLVRGLDYYSHTTFEFTSQQIGAQNTILAGGRYDDLSILISKNKFPGVGWAAGIERLALLIDSQNSMSPLVCLISQSDLFDQLILKIYKRLINENIRSEIIYNGSLVKKLKRADKVNSSFAIIIGEDEIEKSVVQLKNLKTGEKKLVDIDTVIRLLKIEDDRYKN